MARVEVRSQAWGTLWDRFGNIQIGQLAAIDTTVYVADTGGATVAPSNFYAGANGSLPGWVEEGDWTLTVNGDSYGAPAVSGDVGARTSSLESGHSLSPATPLFTAAQNTTHINDALAARDSDGGGVVELRERNGDTYTNGGHVIPPGVTVVGLRRQVTKVVNRGSSYTFRLTDESSGGPGCGLKHMSIHGALSGVPAVSGAVGVELGNGYGFDVEEVFIDGFNDNGSGLKFHNTPGALAWTGGHHIRHISVVNCTRCVHFIADASADLYFGDIDIFDILIQPSTGQVGIRMDRGLFYNNRIFGHFFYAGDNVIAIDVASDGWIREGSYFHITGETAPANTGTKRIKVAAGGQFDASGKIFITNIQPPDDSAGVFNFVEEPHTFYEAEQIHQFTIASASNITIPGGSDWFELTGTTSVNVINTSWDGRVVTLKAAAAVQLTVAGNIKLNGGVAVNLTADDQIMLSHRSGVWRQVAPVSVN